MQIRRGEQMKKHRAINGALLICLTGEALYECVDGTNEEMSNGDYVNIPPNLEHWVSAHKDAQLVLIQ